MKPAAAAAARHASTQPPTSALVVAGDGDPVAARVAAELAQAGAPPQLFTDRHADLDIDGADVLVYLAESRASGAVAPDLTDARAVFDRCARSGSSRLLLVSSAAAIPPHHWHPGMTTEAKRPQRGRNAVADCWLDLEDAAREALGARADADLTILRPAAVVAPGAPNFFSRWLARRWVFALAGYDPVMQFLTAKDLARAIRLVLERGVGGLFHAAPKSGVPLRAALRLAGARRVPLPHWLSRLGRKAFSKTPPAQLAQLRHSWTLSGLRAGERLGFEPASASADAVLSLKPGRAAPTPLPEWDPYGMDRDAIALLRKTLLGFLHNRYWRVEYRGLEQVPREGAGVLVGVHRGFMPLDATMILYKLSRDLGRCPRFLIHPCLIKHPFLAPFIVKQGGLVACRENADWVLSRGALLGVYPEGIRGAFTFYKDAYTLGKFGRDEYVKMALRWRAPIIPFVTIGSAEIFPILGRVDWRWFRRLTEWPFLPITPTFPLLPIPLPSKWHTQFLEPIRLHLQFPPEAAEDAAAVRRIGSEIKNRMHDALLDLRARRKRVFWGDIFSD